MKILFAATPLAGHLTPILALARMAIERGDDVLVSTATYLGEVVNSAGIHFLPLEFDANINLTQVDVVLPGLRTIQPGPALIRYAIDHVFVDPMLAQLNTLRTAIIREAPDIIITDAGFMGRAALFLDPDRPLIPLISCGFTALTLDRPDGAPICLGLPPARDEATLASYERTKREFDAIVDLPNRTHASAKLAKVGLPSLPYTVMGSWIMLADAYLHPTVPAFEFDYGSLPTHIHFVGVLPPSPSRTTSLPVWWNDVFCSRTVVLVTQGTMANTDFSELVEPALQALGERDDMLIVVTTGGRPVSDIRGPIPANARLAEFLDYEALLPKLAMLITNGGYGTVQLALRAGIPIVAAGRTEDKAEVGARIAWSGVGIEIPKQRPSVDDLRDAVGRVLSEPSYRARARVIAADMAAIDTRAEILGVLDGLVAKFRSGGQTSASAS